MIICNNKNNKNNRERGGEEGGGEEILADGTDQSKVVQEVLADLNR